jgi:hypothetical protein
MAAIFETCSTDVFYRLGWVLLHSLWQFALIAIVLAVAIEILRRRSAALRYVVCCGALASTIPAVIVTFALIPDSPIPDSQPSDNRVAENSLSSVADEPLPAQPGILGEHIISTDLPSAVDTPPHSPIDGSFTASINSIPFEEAGSEETVAVAESKSSADSSSLMSRLTAAVRPWLPVAALAWLCGVLLLSIWNLGGWFGVMRIRRMARKPICREITDRLECIAQKMKLRQSVQLFQSAMVEIPVIIGWWRPVLLMPVGLVTGMSPQQLDSLLVHELAHVRRHDYLVNLFQTAMETLLFYHPAVWWI